MNGEIVRQGSNFARVRVMDENGKSHVYTVVRMNNDKETIARAQRMLDFEQQKPLS